MGGVGGNAVVLRASGLMGQVGGGAGGGPGDGAAVGMMICMGVVYLAVIILVVAGMWKVFTKAGKPGWAALVPIYNLIVLLEIVDKPVWWIILLLIPCVNIIVSIPSCVCMDKP